MYNWTDLVNCINRYDDVVLLTHTNMDGDAMGSASALCSAIRKLGKRCVVLLEDDIPGYLGILNRDDNRAGEPPYFVKSMPFKAELAIVLDCGDEKRIEKRLDVFRNAELRLCVDHHIQTESFADYSVVDPDLAATGLLVYELILALGVSIDVQIAEDLYVAIVTDTGRFKYSNTTAHVHRVVADLYQYGFDHVRLCNAIFDSFPMSQIKAEGIATDNMVLFADGKGVISSISLSEMKQAGASYDQIDTCIDRIRIVEGTEIAAFLKEKEENVIKVSLRAKSYADVNRVAKALGGGGHERAAGATLYTGLDEAKKILIAEMEKELKRF